MAKFVSVKDSAIERAVKEKNRQKEMSKMQRVGDVSMDSEDGGFKHMNGNLMEEDDEPEIAAIKARLVSMEEEAKKLCDLQFEVDQDIEIAQANSNLASQKSVSDISIQRNQFNIKQNLSAEERMRTEKREMDSRSVYVGNVDYGTTAYELEEHFKSAGEVARVTILCNKFDGAPKGFAYVEFEGIEAAQRALAMDGTELRARVIKVMRKRTNQPGISSTNRPPRGFGIRGRGEPGISSTDRPSRGFGVRGRGLGYIRRGRSYGVTRPSFRGFNPYYSPY